MRFALASMCALLIAAPAFAQHVPALDEKIELGSFTLAGGQSATVDRIIAPNNNPVVGFSVSFDYDDTVDPFAYASDLRISIFPPAGPPVAIGGYDNFVSPPDIPYDHQGPSDTGHFDSGPHYAWQPGIPKGGPWVFNLLNDFSFNGAVSWNNISITLHKVPEPATLSLLALGGLALLRRR